MLMPWHFLVIAVSGTLVASETSFVVRLRKAGDIAELHDAITDDTVSRTWRVGLDITIDGQQLHEGDRILPKGALAGATELAEITLLRPSLEHPAEIHLVAGSADDAQTAARRLAPWAMATNLQCEGTVNQRKACPNLPVCADCKPEDCVFGEWVEWSTCRCFKQERHRTMIQRAKCGGARCQGDLHELRHCTDQTFDPECAKRNAPPTDCDLESWGQWGDCSAETNTELRVRSYKGATKTGRACGGGVDGTLPAPLQQTRSCGHFPIVDCLLTDWTEWIACSRTCGEGHQTRLRRVKMPAVNGGNGCTGATLETQPCGTEPCGPPDNCRFGEWDEWSGCEISDIQTRKREPLYASNGGQACIGELEETTSCPKPKPPPPCDFTPWTDWEPCDKTCGGGPQFRSRSISTEGPCISTGMEETKPCATQSCSPPTTDGDCEFGEWSYWSDCSTTCGRGQKSRKREVTQEMQPGGQGCNGQLKEWTGCQSPECSTTDCVWENWSEWSACSCTCGGGTRKRDRQIASAPRNGGELCKPVDKSEIGPCNTQSCDVTGRNGTWTPWTNWLECSVTCGQGYKKRHRHVATDSTSCPRPNFELGGIVTVGGRNIKVTDHALAIQAGKGSDTCGFPIDGAFEEYASCKRQPCGTEKDCEYTNWGDWSACSCECNGVQERSRHIRTFRTSGQLACGTVNEPGSLRQIKACSDTRVVNSGGCESIDCVMGSWTEWSECTATCGGGEMHRSRHVITMSSPGGIPCVGPTAQLSGCGMEPCGECPPIDCVWDQWSEWSACSHCGGQKTRHRVVLKHANQCGKPCDSEDARETTGCPKCKWEPTACHWSEWSDSQSECSVTCGLGTKTKERHLRLRAVKDLTAQDLQNVLFRAEGYNNQCEGIQTELIQCKGDPTGANPLCHPDCPDGPVHCVMGDWSEWSNMIDGSVYSDCTFLCERFRAVEVYNNHCGNPCERQPIHDTQHCEPQSPNMCNRNPDCVVGAWSAWSHCVATGSQKYRTRSLATQAMGTGQRCKTSLIETASCGSSPPPDVNCHLTNWGAWTSCSATCHGTKQRKRHIRDEALGNGDGCTANLLEMENCGGPCHCFPQNCALSVWSEWTACHHMQHQRTRTIDTYPKCGGTGCTSPLVELKDCPPPKEPECEIDDWSDWDACDKSCDVGQQHRHRIIHQGVVHAYSHMCMHNLTEYRACNVAPCNPNNDCTVASWSEWTMCPSCGSGRQTRERALTSYARNGGEACTNALSEARGCPYRPCSHNRVDCEWNDWEEWGACTLTCGGGHRQRHKHLKHAPREGGRWCEGGAAKQEVEACHTQSCNSECIDGTWHAWSAWNPCTASCGGGVRYQTRSVAVTANFCGKAAVGLTHRYEHCGTQPCEPDVDCSFNEWSEWGDCSCSCYGTRERSRTIRTPTQGKGKCTGELKVVAPCNPGPSVYKLGVSPTPLGPPPAGCNSGPPVNCILSDWSEWKDCSASCGVGEHSRTRHVRQEAENGGLPCSGETGEVGTCILRPCPEETPVIDCTWEQWGEWSACSRSCNGQRHRIRRVEHYGSSSSEVHCEKKDAMQTEGCDDPDSPGDCAPAIFCEWTDWEVWGACSATCGPGYQQRPRYLEQKKVDPNHIMAGRLYEDRSDMMTKDIEARRLRELGMAFGFGMLSFSACFLLVRVVRNRSMGRREPSMTTTQPEAVPMMPTAEGIE